MDDSSPRVHRPIDKRPERILLEGDFDPKLANMPRGAWEALSYLRSEHDKAIERVGLMQITPDLDWMRALTLSRWEQVRCWIEQLEEKSVGVQGFRSLQMVQVATANPDLQARQSSGIVPQQPGAQPEVKKRGLLPGR